MKKNVIPVLTIFFISLFSGCAVKPFSLGEGGEILIVADEIDRPIIRKQIEASFGRIIETPQPEPLFNLTWITAEELSAWTRTPVILLASTLDGEGSTADFLKKMLSPEVAEGVEKGEYQVFNRRDPWARDQAMFVIAARNRRELGEGMDFWVDSLFEWTMDFEYDRLLEKLLHRAEDKTLEKMMIDDFGLSIRLQADFTPSMRNDSLNFIRIIRYRPERWLMINWGEMDTDSLLTPEFIYGKRKELGDYFADPVDTYDDHWQWENVTFAGKPAIRVRGLWAAKNLAGGGPFFTYGVWNRSEKRYYIVDCAVLAPGEEKTPFLWQLDVMAQSFSMESQD